MPSPYSGYATRHTGRYSARPSVPGVNPDHFKPDPEPDPFSPRPATPENQGGTVLTGERNFLGSGHDQPSLAAQPIHHWYGGQPSVPSNVETASRMQAMAERMMLDHSDTNYVPDGIRSYRHATEGQQRDFVIGRMPWVAGQSLPDGVQYLANGKNAYDQTNQPNEVYAGDAANVGRYRLGVKTVNFGLYDRPLGKFGQEAMLRAYEPLHPALPQDKPQMTGTAPYTPNSTGRARWWPAPPSQTPSTFSLPSDTQMTDYAALKGAAGGSPDFFEDEVL